MKDKAKDLYYSNSKSGLKAGNAQDAIDEVSGKVDQIAGDQIPQEYLEKAVDEYVNNNSGGFATQSDLGELSSEIVEIQKELNLKQNILEGISVTQGVLSLYNGTLSENANYITTDFIKFPTDKVFVEIPKGSQFAIVMYYEDKSFYASGPWQTESMLVEGIDSSKYYRYCFTLGGVTNPSDISQFKINVNSDTLSEKVADIEKEVYTLKNYLEGVNVTQGTLNVNNGEFLSDTNSITTDLIQFPIDKVYLDMPSGAKFRAFVYFPDKSYHGGGNWNTESMLIEGVDTNSYYRFSFSFTGILPKDISLFKILKTNEPLSSRVENIEEKLKKDKGLGGTTQRFTVDVNCFTHNVDNNTTELQDGVSVYTDNGFIMLPDTYTDNGTPTRLVISCHGAGGSVTINDSQVEQQPLSKYLVANGYAVMDVNGLPQEYATLKGIDINNNIGSPIAIQSYIKAYHYCMENFNLYNEVFVFGASMGGISSTNLVMSGTIPVIAHGAYCPVLDTYNEIFLNPWSGGLPKIALGKFYDLETDANGYIYDEEKIRGYNPVNNKTVTIEGLKYTDYPVPVKFWQCENDNIVSIDITKNFINAIKRMGRTAHLRKFVSGGHDPQTAGTPLNNTCGNTNFRGETVSVYPAIEEVFLWFERHNK